MKKIFYNITAAVLTLGLASCAKEALTPEQPVTPEPSGLMTIVANIGDDASTKTTLSGDDQSGYKVLWSEGDQIRFYIGETVKEYFTYTLTEGAGTKFGVFTGPAIPEEIVDYTAYAVYGDNIIYGYAGSLDEQQYYAPDNAAFSFPMAAKATISNGKVTLDDFKNIGGLLRLDLKGSGTVKEIKVSANQPLSGGIIRIDDDGAAVFDSGSWLTAHKYVTLNCSASGVELSSRAKPFYISLPKNDYTGVKIEVTSTNNRKYTKTLKEGKSLNITRSQITPVSFTVSGLVDPINLSAAGTANCYIVSKGGDYFFDATKKGNTKESVGTIAYASLLWESFGIDEQPKVGDIISNVSFKNGTVSFTASGVDGNAVIAVYNDHYEAIWSWHIWVCNGYNPDATAQVYYNGAGTVMDRNLGATSATKGDLRAVGLTYQWGRKDPFLNGAINAKSAGTAFDSVPSNMYYGTIDYVVKHPTIFVNGNDMNHDWYYTGDSSTDNTRWNSSKGKYDPCPRGWRVPDGDGENGLWAKALGISTYIMLPWDDINIGVDLTGLVSDAPEVWYPATDILGWGRGWSCTPSYFWANNYDFRSNNSFTPSYASSRSDCLSVRCVKQ